MSMKDKNKEVIKVLEENKLTNIYSPEQQIVKTLEDEKKELAAGMKESRHQEYVRKEMANIRAEGKMKEEGVTDTHKIIKEAEKRVAESAKDIAVGKRIKAKELSEPLKDLLREKTESEKMQEQLEPLPYCPMSDE